MISKFLAFVVVILVVSLVFLNFAFLPETRSEFPDFFVGVSAAYADVDAIKVLIDEVSSYTNIFVIGSDGVSAFEDKLNEVCQYLVDKGMYFIVFADIHFQLEAIKEIEKKFSEYFLGIYFSDEQGGRQLDDFEYADWVTEANNFSDATDQFVYHLHYYLNAKELMGIEVPYAPADFRLFSSDYALYWFDYLAGYDTIFAEFGWNYSRQLNVALNRGAATMQDKDWGAIITWTFNGPPYIGSGSELYDDLVYAYDNGAKYVLVFDSNENYTQSILREEHFEALEGFWQYTKDTPRKFDGSGRVAFVLPKDFGYGFRGPEDKIWGLWEADETSLQISYHLGEFLKQYETRLDVIYDGNLILDQTYSKYIFWNGTVIEPLA
jgi:hypothetical protein